MKSIMSANHAGPLLFFDLVNHYGGSSQVTVALIKALSKQTEVIAADVYGSCPYYMSALLTEGINLTILSPAGRRQTYIGGTGRLQRMVRMLLFFPEMLRIIYRLNRYVSKIHPRAVWVNSEKALFICWLALPGHIPLAAYVHTQLQAVRWYCRFAWQRVNLVVGVSQKSLAYLTASHLAHRTFATVYNGIDVDQVIQDSQKEVNLNVNEKPGLRIVLPASMGSLLKGHEVAIHALARFLEQGGSGQLFFCGDVPPGAPTTCYESIQHLVTELGLAENVHFLGWRNDILPVMSKCDLVLLPSFSEGLPLCLLEAMALGKPVIATRVGGIPELVRDKIDGLLIEHGDVDGLTRALFQLVDPVQRKRMGESAQNRVKEHFSLARQASEFLNSVNRIAGS